MAEDSKKVLIVEDDLPQREALQDKFLKEGFVVILAKNGEEGLKVALEDHPDAILLDLVMPRMDGIEMAKRLREDEWGKEVPVVILTALSDTQHVQEAVDCGVFEYMVKGDVKMEDIVQKVQSLVA